MDGSSGHVLPLFLGADCWIYASTEKCYRKPLKTVETWAIIATGVVEFLTICRDENGRKRVVLNSPEPP